VTAGERKAAMATERASLGSVLVRRANRQQPYPDRQLGLHIHDMLARGHQLLGQQMTEAAGALDRPAALGERSRPHQETLDLAGAGAHPQLAQHRPVASMAVAVCDPLCGSTPIITAMNLSLDVG
jgi:hypothetical protein